MKKVVRECLLNRGGRIFRGCHSFTGNSSIQNDFSLKIENEDNLKPEREMMSKQKESREA
jgi:hypothetical protein